MLTFVLPLLFKDIKLADSFLLPSLEKFVKCNCSVLIVCKDDEFEELSCIADKFCSLDIEMLSEDDVLDQTAMNIKNHWYKQQIIKLMIASKVKTDWYCTLDADMFMFKPCSFVEENRAILTEEPLDLHSDWWNASSKCLGIPLDCLQYGFGVTPAMINTKICRQLISEYNIPQCFVGNGPVSEYTLYWLYLNKNYRVSDYYHTGAKSLYCTESLWGSKQITEAMQLGGIREYVNKYCTRDAEYSFFIFQSLLTAFSLQHRKHALQDIFRES